MPIAGTDLGKVWQGQEGMGIAEKVDTSQSDGMKQYGFKLKLADLKERQAGNKATQANIYKRTQKPEWWSIHDSELSQTHSDLMNETARLMRTKGVQDPFALSADPEVIELQKKWNGLETMAKTSKDLREYSQKMQDAEFRKTVDEDSFNQFNEWFGKNKISDIVKNGSQPPSIRKKNPIEDFGTYWMPFIKQNGGFEDKDGNELSREALSNIVAMKYASPNPDLAAFDQKMLTGLDPKITAALEAEQKKQALQGNQKSLGQIYAENQLWRLAQSQVTPYNETSAIGEAAKSFDDVRTKVESGTTTITRVNNSQEFETRAQEASKNYLLGGSPQANKALRKYGITQDAIQRNTPEAQKAISDFASKVKLAKKKDYERSEDELKKWEIDLAKKALSEGQSDGAMLLKEAKKAINNGDNHAPVMGVLKNTISLGAGKNITDLRVKWIPNPLGTGANVKVLEADYNILNSNGNWEKSPTPQIIDLNDEAAQGAILGQYQSKTSESKGNKISNISNDIKGAKGTFDNFTPNTPQKNGAKDNKSVGKSNAW